MNRRNSNPEGPRHKNAPKRNALEMTKIRAQVVAMYLEGASQYEIAAKLGISRDMVRFDLGVVQEEYRKEAQLNFAESKALHIRKVDHLYRTAWNAWTRSIEEKRGKTRTVKTAPKKGERARTITDMTEEEMSFGDPRYMETMRWCLAERAKLEGLYPEVTKAGEVQVIANHATVIKLPAFAPVRTAPIIDVK